MSLSVKTQGGGGLSASIFVKGLSESDTVYATKQVPLLPGEYTQLEYIESSGTQYIDTGCFGSDKTKASIDFQLMSTANAYLFGWAGQGSTPRYALWYYKSDGGLGIEIGSNNKTTSIDTNIRHKAITTGDAFIVDGVTVSTYTSSAYTTPSTMYVFARNDTGASTFASMKLFSMKIEEDGVLVRDYVPAKRNSDGVLGLYDLVSGEFYTNAGTGTFVAGAERTDYIDGSVVKEGKWTEKANPEVVALPDDYTQLDFIESSGTQYIDTGVVATNNLGFYFDFLMKSPFDSEGYALFGSYTTNEKALTLYTGNSRYSDGGFSFGENRYHGGFVIGSRMQAELSGGVYKTSTGQNFSVTSGATTDFEISCYLFASHDTSVSGNIYALSSAQLYSAKIYDGNTVVRDFVPAKRNSDSVLGLYDLANGVFYTNAGTGEFIAGAETPATTGGHLISRIKDLGMWTVTATNGEKTRMVDVLVDVATEYEIEIDLNAVYLFDYGRQEYQWQPRAWKLLKATSHNGVAPSVTQNADGSVTVAFSAGSTNYAGGVYEMVEDIDLTNYKTVIFYYDYAISGYSTSCPAIHFTVTNRNDGGYLDAPISENETTVMGNDLTAEIDVSSVGGSYDILVGFYTRTDIHGTGTMYATIKEVRLV